MENHGGNSAQQPANSKESLNRLYPTEMSDVRKLVGFSDVTIDDMIAMHLVDCDQCHKAVAELKPVALGQKSGHCDTYWHLQLMRAKYEGTVNNIVSHTEYGDEAPKGRPLE